MKEYKFVGFVAFLVKLLFSTAVVMVASYLVIRLDLVPPEPLGDREAIVPSMGVVAVELEKLIFTEPPQYLAVARGSGFMLGDRRIVSVTHGFFDEFDTEPIDNYFARFVVTRGRGVSFVPKVACHNAVLDVSILEGEIAAPPDALTLGDENLLRVDEELIIRAEPFGFPIPVRGRFLSKARRIARGGEEIILLAIEVLSPFNPLHKGASGGAVLNQKNEVVGMIKALSKDKKVTFAIPASTIKSIKC